MNTQYNGQGLFWEVDYVKQTVAFERDILVEHAVSSAGECGWKVDFWANFSLTVKRKKIM